MPELPPEVIGRIIQHVGLLEEVPFERRTWLAKVSLVSSVWRGEAQHLLWRNLFLEAGRGDCQLLERTLAAGNARNLETRSFSLNVSADPRGTCVGKANDGTLPDKLARMGFELLRRFPYVQRFIGYGFTNNDWTGCLDLLPCSLTSLALERSHDAIVYLFLRLNPQLASMVLLNHYSSEITGGGDLNSEFSESAGSSIGGQLRSLSVRLCDSRPIKRPPKISIFTIIKSQNPTLERLILGLVTGHDLSQIFDPLLAFAKLRMLRLESYFELEQLAEGDPDAVNEDEVAFSFMRLPESLEVLELQECYSLQRTRWVDIAHYITKRSFFGLASIKMELCMPDAEDGSPIDILRTALKTAAFICRMREVRFDLSMGNSRFDLDGFWHASDPTNSIGHLVDQLIDLQSRLEPPEEKMTWSLDLQSMTERISWVVEDAADQKDIEQFLHLPLEPSVAAEELA